jgi:ribose transport system permease protein
MSEILKPSKSFWKNIDVLRMLDSLYKYGLYGILIILVILFSSINKNFLSVNNARNLLLQTSSSGIAAAGLVFVMITGGIDISIGATIFISAVISATLTDLGLNLVGAIGVSLLVGALIGIVNGFLIAKMNMVPLIVTLAMQYILRGLAIGIIGIRTLFFNNDVGKYLVRTRIFDFVPLIVIVLLIIIIITQFILSRSLYGRHIYAIGNNRGGAEKIGINVKNSVWIAYIICGALAGLSGLVSGAQVGAISPTFATGQEFIIISSTVLGGVSLFGGRGKVFPNAFIGVLIIMCIENGLVMAKTNMYAYTIVRGCIIFIAVMLDSVKNKGETR